MSYERYPDDHELNELNAADGYDFTIPIDRVRYAKSIVALWDDAGACKWDGYTLDLSTGGWSGNEEVLDNINMLFHTLCWLRSERGGKIVYQVIDPDDISNPMPCHMRKESR